MDDIGAKLLAARASGQPVPVADQAGREISIRQAYDVQAQVVAKTGTVGGWKVGAAGLEATPVWAPIFHSDILASGANLARSPGSMVGIEVEIAFRAGPDTGAKARDGAGLAEMFTSAHLAIEYVESRLERPADAADGWKLADNQINGGLVVGGAIADWPNIDAGRQWVRLEIDGTVTIDERRENPGGNPLRLLKWALTQSRSHCGGLAAGQIITTGSLSGIQWYRAPTRIHAELPELEVSVAVDL